MDSQVPSRWVLYRRLLAYLAPYRGQFAAALFFMVLFGATDGVVPFLVKKVLDGVFAAQNKTLLTLFPVILMIFAVVRAGSDFFQQYLMGRVGHFIVRDIRNQIQRHLLALSTDFYAFRSTADLVSRVTSDVILVRSMLTESVASVIRDSIRVVALLGAAIYLDPVLALIAALVFPIGIYPIYRFGRKLRRLSRVGQEAIGALSSLMQQSAIGNRVVKIFGREDFEHGRFQAENESLTKTFIKAERIKALTGPVNEVLASLVVSGVILYGGFSVIGGIRTQGDFIAFLISVFLLYDPFKKLTRISSSVQQGMAGAERLFEVLDTASSIKEPAVPKPMPSGYRIEISDVDFAYPGRPGETNQHNQAALKSINLVFEEGKKIALVGFSGAGKSTLMDLVPRFIDPQKGRVKIGGTDVRDVSLSELRSRIAMVGQHTFLFHDTVFNNISYGLSGAGEQQVRDAAQAAFALDFIESMPNGFQTMIGEGGLTLSGGERQRIAIARAILKDAPILILDEATASLDNRSEREVQSALEALEKGRTTIVIAHRLSTVRNADLIVVLKDGQVAEIGSHDELLRLRGEFSRLYALQFSAAASEPSFPQ